MTDPNKATQSDILEARERVKRHQNPAHYAAIDAGLWDPFAAVQAELCEMIRERTNEGEVE